ncbi:ABC transporter substrate-binding protein [Propionicicella superfundia]|uniref:ABC transporter substrate-binding protein n=1 Tax=Propionicicella superfundia TaxID=348582 RepID=UPI00040518CC|nr:ABC transporter substrate-binding protein [Propionicicella superfundia]
MTRTLTRTAIAVLAGAVALSLGACSSPQTSTTSAAPTTVGIAMQPWIGYGPWYIAKDQGFDVQNGVSLDLVTFTTDADAAAAFTSGKVVGANSAINSLGHLVHAGQEHTIVMLEDVSTTADAILAGSGVDSIADLKGKKVAFEAATTSDLLLRYALSTAGLTTDDITVVPTPAANAGAALLSGSVDAAVTYEPYISAAVAQGKDVKLLYTAGEKPGLIADVFTVNTPWAKENPDTVKSLLRAWDAAVAYLKENPDEGHAIIAEAVGASVEDLETSFEGVQIYTLDESNTYLAGDFASTAREINKIQVDSGDTDVTGVDLPSLVDTSHGVEAAKK